MLFYRDHNTVSIVGPLTLLVYVKQYQEIDDSNNTDNDKSNLTTTITTITTNSNEQNPTFSCTSVVKNIIQTIIEPKMIFSPYDHSSIQGMLLLGPPGVGKSFAISAVKKLCKNSCKVFFFLLLLLFVVFYLFIL